MLAPFRRKAQAFRRGARSCHEMAQAFREMLRPSSQGARPYHSRARPLARMAHAHHRRARTGMWRNWRRIRELRDFGLRAGNSKSGADLGEGQRRCGNIGRRRGGRKSAVFLAGSGNAEVFFVEGAEFDIGQDPLDLVKLIGRVEMEESRDAGEWAVVHVEHRVGREGLARRFAIG